MKTKIPVPPLEKIELNETQFRAFVAQLARQAGGLSELARQLDVTGQHIGALVAGKKRPGPKFLGAIGARAQTIYTVTIQQTAEPRGRRRR
jgi:hypothetical protein